MSQRSVRVAWFTSYSRYSAIGQCSLSVLRALRQSTEVTVFASDIRRASEALSDEFDLRVLAMADPETTARDVKDFDVAVYNLGDHFPMHHRTYDVAVRAPGIVILHDLVMHHFFSGMYLGGRVRDDAGYLGELEYAHGPSGRRLGEDILGGRLREDVWEGPLMLKFHMGRSAVRNALGVIVHSEFARGELASLASVPVRHVPFPRPLSPLLDEGAAPAPLPARSGRVKLLTFGVVNPNKMVDHVIGAIGASDALRDGVEYDIIGDHSHTETYSQLLRDLIRDQGLQTTVRMLGRQDDDTLRAAVWQADVVLNLRNPHFGESSWSLLESMFAGKPTIVWKHGFYDEVPDDAVRKVSSVDELQAALEHLAQDTQERVRLGRAAFAYAAAAFSADSYARSVLEFDEAVRYNAPVLKLADFVAETLGGLGATETDTVDRVVAELVTVSGVRTSESA
jgi:glycosyltransferase involved in cell wall biosynthesis